MSYLTRLMKQNATYWAKSSFDPYGDTVFSSPTAITCRWEDRTELFLSPKGDEQHSRAVVWSTSSLAVDGYLYLGTSVSANPETVSGADRIRNVANVPSINARESLYKAFL